MNNKPILYTFFGSSSAHRVRIALNLKKVEYEPVCINLLAGEQRKQEYEEVNPNKTVPALKLPNGEILIESVAIVEYLNELLPEPSLLPKDLVQRARIRGFVELINSGVQPYQKQRLFDYLGEASKLVDRHQFTKEMLEQSLQILERILSKETGQYCFGDEITLADVFLVPQIFGAKHRFQVNLLDYPRIEYLYNKLSKLPEFIRASPEQQPDYKA